MCFVLLGCGQHTFEEILGDLLGLSSSSDYDEESSSSRSRSSSSNHSSSGSSSSSSLGNSNSSGSSNSSSSSGGPSSPAQVVNTAEEIKLYDLIMAYRLEKGLSIIPMSKSLTYVAQVHVRDLFENASGFETQCNMHSWSAQGSWAPCCYTSDHAAASCMWSKPRELTPYTSSGYEIAYWQSSLATAELALNGWKNSSGHNAVIINEGTWVNMEWKAIGIGIYKTYAVAWFGDKLDNL